MALRRRLAGCHRIDVLIPAELIADLAKSAKLRPLVHPADAAPERGYTPSQSLADFVRCRDLTCRFPGCDKPAVRCDVDHTIPHADGGRTHASNLKCLCRLHHLFKTFWAGTISNYPTARWCGPRQPGRPMSPRRAAPCCSPVSAYPSRCPSRFPPAAVCGSSRDDAQTPPHPRPESRQLRCRRTAAQPGVARVHRTTAGCRE